MSKNYIEWDGVRIGRNDPVVVIAEACDNHFGSLDRAKAMIREAKNAGVDVIKFQHHLADEEMLPDAPMSDNFDEPLYEFLKKNALTISQHLELKDYCKKVGIAYLCTPFSFPAAKELVGIGLEVFKIGSGEMRDVYYLKKLKTLNRPVIISTGMCRLEEMDKTYKLLSDMDMTFCLMNCLSEYPPKYEDMNLNVVREMQDRYPGAIIGHSDHTPSLYTSFAAVTMGAKVIEKHFTIDKSLKGPDSSVSIDSNDFRQLVEGVRIIERSMGGEKKVNATEEPIRKWAYRSVVTNTSIKKGETITEGMLCTKRPGTGILSEEIDQVVGRIARQDIDRNVMLSWSHLENSK